MEEENVKKFIVSSDEDDEFEFNGNEIFEKVQPHSFNTRSRKNSVKKIEQKVPSPKEKLISKAQAGATKVESKKSSKKPTPSYKSNVVDKKGVKKQEPSLVAPEGGVKIIKNPLDGEVIVISGELNHTNDRKDMQ